MATEAVNNFRSNFEKLEQISSKMRTQQKPDIDNLVQDVEAATTAYHSCMERIKAVREALGKVDGFDKQPEQ